MRTLFWDSVLQDDPPPLTPCDILVDGVLAPSSSAQSVLNPETTGSQVELISDGSDIVSNQTTISSDTVMNRTSLCAVPGGANTLPSELLTENGLVSSLGISLHQETVTDFPGPNLIQELDV